MKMLRWKLQKVIRRTMKMLRWKLQKVEDVEVEVKENVEREVQEDVELEIDQVEVGTVLLKRTLLT